MAMEVDGKPAHSLPGSAVAAVPPATKARTGLDAQQKKDWAANLMVFKSPPILPPSIDVPASPPPPKVPSTPKVGGTPKTVPKARASGAAAVSSNPDSQQALAKLALNNALQVCEIAGVVWSSALLPSWLFPLRSIPLLLPSQ